MGIVFGSTFVAQIVQAGAMAVVINLAIHPGVAVSFGFGVWALEVGNAILNCVLMGGFLAYMQG